MTAHTRIQLVFRWVVACVALGVLWHVPDRVHAQQPGVIHTLKEGESFESIAEQYYGDPGLDRVLEQHNGLSHTHGVVSLRGLQIIVPFAFYYRVGGDASWLSLAERFLGDRKRAFLLQYINRLSPDGKTVRSAKKDPDPGEEVLIPFVLRHMTGPGENLHAISESYFSTKDYFRILQRFNGFRSSRTPKGTTVLVPIWHLRLSSQGKKMAEASVQSAIADGSVLAMQTQAAAVQLPRLQQMLSEGRYVEAIVAANQLLGAQQLTLRQQAQVHQTLAVAYVALRREDLAVESFRHVLKHDPSFSLDVAQTSPLVLEAYRKAKAR